MERFGIGIERGGRIVCVCVWVTRIFPVAMARDSGEWPLQRRSVLARWESRRATTLLAFCKDKMHFIYAII